MSFFGKVIDLISKCGKAITGLFKKASKAVLSSPKATIVTVVSGITVVKSIINKINEIKLTNRKNKAKRRKEKERFEREERILANFEPVVKPNKYTKSKMFDRYTDACKSQKKYGGPIIVLSEKQEEFVKRYQEEEATEAFKLMPKYQQLWLIESMYTNLEEFEEHVKRKEPKKTGLRNYLYYNYNLGAPKFKGMNKDNGGYPNPFKETKNFKGFFGKHIVKPIDELIYRLEVGYNKPEYPTDQFEMFTDEERALFTMPVISDNDIEIVKVNKIQFNELVNINDVIRPRDFKLYYKAVKNELIKENLSTIYITDLKDEVKEYKNRKKKEKAQFKIDDFLYRFRNADGLDAREIATAFHRAKFLTNPYDLEFSKSTSAYKYKDYDMMSKEERENVIEHRRYSKLSNGIKLAIENKDYALFNNFGQIVSDYGADDEVVKDKDYLAYKKAKKSVKKDRDSRKLAKGETVYNGFSKAREDLGIREKRERMLNLSEIDDKLIDRVMDDSVYSKYRDRDKNRKDVITLEKVNNDSYRMKNDYDDVEYRIENRDRRNRNHHRDDDDDDERYNKKKNKKNKKLKKFIEYERRSDYGEYDPDLDKRNKRDRDEEYV